MTELMVLDRVKKNEEEFVTDIIETKGANLPAKIDEVLNVFEFTDFKAKAWKIMAEKLSKLEDQQDAYNSALRSGQQWGIAALYSQKRMGEITRDIDPEENMRNTETGPRLMKDGDKGSLTHHRWSESERIAANPEILDRVIESSKQRGEIPTKTAVLNHIRFEQQKKYAEERKERNDQKIAKTIPKIVADHYEWVKLSKHHLELALIGAKNGGFDPTGRNFMLKKHNEIRELLTAIEENV